MVSAGLPPYRREPMASQRSRRSQDSLSAPPPPLASTTFGPDAVRPDHYASTVIGNTMKRLFDIVVCSVLLAIFSPVMALAALAVALSVGRPILFSQVRPGLHGKPFRMFKFRTMRVAMDENGIPLSDAERLTPTGSFLRNTSLDELPGLINVMKGDMSLVGPRPLLMRYLDRYDSQEARRHEVRPGLTGWAQVNGRNALSWPKKFALDVWYVDNQSMLLDLRILALTLLRVVRRDGISAPGEATMPEFMGSDHHRREEASSKPIDQ